MHIWEDEDHGKTFLVFLKLSFLASCLFKKSTLIVLDLGSLLIRLRIDIVF